MKVGDLVRPQDKGWKKYRKSMGIVVKVCSGQVSVQWFDDNHSRNDWSKNYLEVISESR